MALEVVSGPPNSGRAGEMLDRFRAALDRAPVLVVPTGDDVAEFERQLCAEGGVTLGASIMTFGALTAEVARALAVELPPPLTEPQRQALVRAAIHRTSLRRLRRSAARPGFAPSLDALIAELQGALIAADQFAAEAGDLDDPGYETELADLYRAYVELRQVSGRADDGLTAEAAVAALRTRAEDWGGRPLFVYGFDDLTRAQLELVAGLARTAPVTIAVTYEDRRALAVRAGLLSTLTEELGAELGPRLPFDPGYTESATLRHLDRNLFEPEAGPIETDEGIALMQSSGARGEAEAIGIEIARLLTGGYEADEIAVVLRRPESAGPLLAAVLRDLGIPVALEASLPLAATAVGGSLVSLCRAALDETAVDDLLAHLRSDPSLPPGAVDRVERGVRRGAAQTVSEATEGWEHPPAHLAELRAASDATARLRALAGSARALAEGAHRGRAPLAGRRGQGPDTPFSALELRAGVVAAELLEQLAAVGELPGCEQPDLDDAIDAIESGSVAQWRGPATGRVRILSPYRARAARVRALFCASLQDGEFPSATPRDPLLSEERRRQIGNRDLRRSEQAEEERYLFHACVSRPTERLYLSWQSSDEDGAALARSAFVDEVLDLLGPDPQQAERRLLRERGPERSVPTPSEATSDRSLARALALCSQGSERESELARLGVPRDRSEAVLGLFAQLPDPDLLPGPLQASDVVAQLAGREAVSANSLEGWLQCPYRWFVDHELAPQRLEPEADPLWLGSVVHGALERLYREPPGEDSIPRAADVGRWRACFAELLEEVATTRARAPLNRARRAALDRARVQVEAFLEAEASTETEFRPARELLELGFGPLDDAATPPSPPLALGQVLLRGRIDRIDLSPDGRSAIVRDYKTAKAVPRAAKFADQGTLQIQLYMLVAKEVLGLEPVAGLYQPLGAASPEKRKPRGIALDSDERLDGLGLVGTDRLDPEGFGEALEGARSRALEAASEMREGRIARRPIGGECPKYCTFQAICRLERAVGAIGEQNGSENGGEK